MFTTIEADREHSISWKKNGRSLLIEASDFESFQKAVKWCGETGNVSRTVKNEYIENFSKYLFRKRQQIKNGTFDISKTKKFGRSTPHSWVSKICHILSPQKYPYIYDEFIRKHFNISSINDFQEAILAERKLCADMSFDDIYFRDSDIWANEKAKKKTAR